MKTTDANGIPVATRERTRSPLAALDAERDAEITAADLRRALATVHTPLLRALLLAHVIKRRDAGEAGGE